MMMTTHTKQVSTATVYVITATAFNSTLEAVLGSVGTLVVMVAIAIIIFVLIARSVFKTDEHYI
jgi:hypothetical protein